MQSFLFLKQVVQGFGKDRVGQLSAAFAYGAIFAIGPLLLVLISVVGFVYGDQAAQGKLFGQISGAVGPDLARTIQNAVAHMHQGGGGVVALIIGIIGSLLGAAGITSQLQNAFNLILGVAPDPKAGIKRTVYAKLKNVLLVVFAGVVVLASLVASAVISGLGSKLQSQVGIPPAVLELINTLVSLAVLTLILYLTYMVVPDVYLPREIAAKAAAVVTVLFIIGKFVLGFIIGRNGTASAYGAAAAFISLLLWIYYSGQILFLGAEGIKVYGDRHRLVYKAKKFTIKRTTLTLDATGFTGRFAEAWVRGFRQGGSK